MHRVDAAVVLVVVLVFGPVIWAFGWLLMDSLWTRSQARARDRIMRRYGSYGRDDGDMGRHSFREAMDDEDGEDRTVGRGRHALDERDEVLAWAWPDEDWDEFGGRGGGGGHRGAADWPGTQPHQGRGRHDAEI